MRARASTDPRPSTPDHVCGAGHEVRKASAQLQPAGLHEAIIHAKQSEVPMKKRLVSGFILIPACAAAGVWSCSAREQRASDDPRIAEVVNAASVGGSSPSHPCPLRLGAKPWEGGSQCTG